MNFLIPFPVSLSQCVGGEPSDELVAKYNEMKATFFARLLNMYNAVRAVSEPLMSSPEVQSLQAYFSQIEPRRVEAAQRFFE